MKVEVIHKGKVAGQLEKQIMDRSIHICRALEGLDIGVGLDILYSAILNTVVQNEYPGVTELAVKNLRNLAAVIEAGEFKQTSPSTHLH